MHDAMREAVAVPTCYIFGAGACAPLSRHPGPGDLTIAADGGYRTVEAMAIPAQLVVGDFDSLGYVPEHPHVVRVPKEKDDTDLGLALRLGREWGYGRFVIFGALGGRLDMTVASLQLLAGLSRSGAEGYLLAADGTVVTAVTDGGLRFSEQCRGTFSVFCHGERALGVSERGVAYPLEDAALTCDMPLGVSNEFLGRTAELAVRSGTLLVFWHGTPEDVSRKSIP